MRRSLPWLALAVWLTGCAASAEVGSFGTTGNAAGGASGQPDAGEGHGSTSGGVAGISGGTSSGGENSGGIGSNAGGSGGNSTSTDYGCNPASAQPCSAGMVCDQLTQVCRLPGYGESCNQAVGCASAPPGMSCTEASYDGNSEQLCLIACTVTDSSACPYGTSCGDPNLPGYCSPAGPGTCTPWSACSLGAGLPGICVPTDQGASCLATGAITVPFSPCDPQASNADAVNLCAGGMVCASAAQLPATVGTASATSGGYCLAPCDGTYGPSCAESQHCVVPSGAAYGYCLPGSACTLGGPSRICPLGWWCLPDTADSTSGGCIESVPDAGSVGSPCEQPVGFTETNPCTDGTLCLPGADGQSSCQALCLLSPTTDLSYDCGEDGGTCASLASNGDGGAAIGVCE